MRRGQATLEYFILFAIIFAIVVGMLVAYSNSGNQQALEDYISGK